jgi:hypothetical protein
MNEDFTWTITWYINLRFRQKQRFGFLLCTRPHQRHLGFAGAVLPNKLQHNLFTNKVNQYMEITSYEQGKYLTRK